jgi:hypothetical protein
MGAIHRHPVRSDLVAWLYALPSYQNETFGGTCGHIHQGLCDRCWHARQPVVEAVPGENTPLPIRGEDAHS